MCCCVFRTQGYFSAFGPWNQPAGCSSERRCSRYHIWSLTFRFVLTTLSVSGSCVFSSCSFATPPPPFLDSVEKGSVFKHVYTWFRGISWVQEGKILQNTTVHCWYEQDDMFTCLVVCVFVVARGKSCRSPSPALCVCCHVPEFTLV